MEAPYPADSSSLAVLRGGWGVPGLVVATRAAESPGAAGVSPWRVAGASGELGSAVERAGASGRTAGGRAGHLDAVWAPEALAEGSGVAGAPGEVGGREEAPGGTGGPSEGPAGGGGEAWAPEWLRGKVCRLDTLVLKRSWRKWGAGR